VVEAGQGTALDVALFDLEKWRAQTRLLESRSIEGDALAALAALVGVSETFFGRVSRVLPSLPDVAPSSEEAQALLVDNHPDLARLRARYEAREAALRLEIAKQWPDLRLGPSASGEVGERKSVFGLSIGIDLPVFDRNQQAIAEASQRREEARVSYESSAKRALAELKRALRAVTLATARHALLRDTVLPRARDSIRLARQSLAAGPGDALRLLDSERSYRTLLIEALDAELSARSAWAELELAVGRPLIVLDGETPDELRAPVELEADDTLWGDEESTVEPPTP
jgi:outer membrane protein TolC